MGTVIIKRSLPSIVAVITITVSAVVPAVTVSGVRLQRYQLVVGVSSSTILTPVTEVRVVAPTVGHHLEAYRWS